MFENINENQYTKVKDLSKKYNTKLEVVDAYSNTYSIWKVYEQNDAGSEVVDAVAVTHVEDFLTQEDAVEFAAKRNIKAVIKQIGVTEKSYNIKLCCTNIDNAKAVGLVLMYPKLIENNLNYNKMANPNDRNAAYIDKIILSKYNYAYYKNKFTNEIKESQNPVLVRMYGLSNMHFGYIQNNNIMQYNLDCGSGSVPTSSDSLFTFSINTQSQATNTYISQYNLPFIEFTLDLSQYTFLFNNYNYLVDYLCNIDFIRLTNSADTNQVLEMYVKPLYIPRTNGGQIQMLIYKVKGDTSVEDMNTYFNTNFIMSSIVNQITWNMGFYIGYLKTDFD